MKRDYLGSDIKKLGFGFMRLPMVGEGKDKVYDLEHTKKMVDLYMEKGFTYFDTAYVYLDGTSEVAIKEALVDRYPRDSFQVATKMPFWGMKSADEMEKKFNESLQRAGVEYFDFYLLHCLNTGTLKQCDEFGGWDFIKELKATGKAKHIGFSFHDTADLLDELLTKHPEVEFVQLQINYIDWESENVQSRKCYEVACKHNVPVIIMEPVKGGTLANVIPSAEKLFKDANPNVSNASWAIRFGASLDNIITVLSGMSNMEQLEDNVSYMENFAPLTNDEKKVIDNVVNTIQSVPTIPCTDCKYCVEGCPMNINIPNLFKLMNSHKKFDPDQNVARNKWQFPEQIQNHGKPSDCIACGKCQNHCPQNIKIIEELATIAKLYE